MGVQATSMAATHTKIHLVEGRLHSASSTCWYAYQFPVSEAHLKICNLGSLQCLWLVCYPREEYVLVLEKRIPFMQFLDYTLRVEEQSVRICWIVKNQATVNDGDLQFSTTQIIISIVEAPVVQRLQMLSLHILQRKFQWRLTMRFHQVRDCVCSEGSKWDNSFDSIYWQCWECGMVQYVLAKGEVCILLLILTVLLILFRQIWWQQM